MTEDFTRAVLQYIGQENARYAYLVNGRWGSGKTHWWNHDAIPAIENSFPDATLIYVSLHGMAEINQIGIQIISQLIPGGGKSSALVAKISNRFVKGLDIGRWIEPSDFKAVLEKLGGAAQPLTICFDDLERSQIPLGSVAGFINQFVEDGDAKVVILCNEDEIDDSATYRRIKEKTVGFTRQFKPDRESVGNSILSQFYADEKFKTFLENNAKHILYVFEASGYENFRILNNVILLLQTAFHAFESIGENIEFEQLFAIVPFAIEYQAGAVPKDEIVRLVQGGAPAIMGAYQYDDNETDCPATIFRDKYAVLRNNAFFKPSACLANLIVEGSIAPDRLKAELDASRPDDSELGQALDKMDYRFFELEQAEFEQCRDLLLDALRGHKIDSLEKYLTIASSMSLAHSTQVIGVDESDLMDAFDAGASAILGDEGCNLEAIGEGLDRTLAQSGSFLAVVLCRFRNQIRQHVYTKQREQLAAAIERVEVYPDSLARLLDDTEQVFSIGRTPIAPLLPAVEFADIFHRSPNLTKAILGRSLEYRYNRNSPVIHADQEWISDIVTLLQVRVADYAKGSIAHHLTSKAADIARRLISPTEAPSQAGADESV